jgi:secreted trypsin-like serine protease
MSRLFLSVVPAAALLAAACAPDPELDGMADAAIDGTTKIYGGSAPDEWYHDAVVSIHNRSSTGSITTTPFCSGTLISTTVVLTAGHCVASGSGVLSPSRVAVYVGDNPRADLSSHDYTVSEVYRHPSYNAATTDYDLALLRLSTPVTEAVTPVPNLPSALGFTSADIGMNLNFAGFGYDEFHNFGYKLQVDLPLGGLGCSVSGCRSAGSTARMISYSQTGGEGPCSGDSGGPAFVNRSGTIYVGGMTSYGDSACTKYGVSARADAFEAEIAAFVGSGGGTTTCSGYEYTKTGSLTGSGDYDYQPDGASFSAASGYHYASLAGASGTDFDLYLYKYSSSRRTWSAVAASETTTSTESISYSGTSGTYLYYVYSYSGSGSYTLCLTIP